MKQPTYYYYGCNELFFLRRHTCPECNAPLTKQKHQKTVNAKSEEAKKYNNFTMDGFGLHGDVLVVTYTFDCPACRRSYGPKELQRIKKEQRIAARKKK